MKNYSLLVLLLLRTLLVFSQPCRSYNITPSKTNYCPGETIVLSSSVSGTTTPAPVSTSYSWTGGLSFSSPTSSSTGVIVPPSSTNAILNVTNVYNHLETNGDFSAGLIDGCITYYPINDGPYSRRVITNPHSNGYTSCPNFNDHTTGTGNMLRVDGPIFAGINDPIFWCQDIFFPEIGSYSIEYFVRSCTYNDAGHRPEIGVYLDGSLINVYTMPVGCTGWLKVNVTLTISSCGNHMVKLSNEKYTNPGDANDFCIDDIRVWGNITRPYIYNVSPTLPSFSVSAFPSATVCCNTSYTVAAISTSGCGTGCTYFWSPTGTTSSTLSSLQPCSPFMASKTYTCVATNSYGCQSKVVFTENFKKEPVITPITTGTSSSICVGGVMTLSATSNVPSSSTWVSSNTSVAAVSSTGVVTAVSSGTATISYVASNPPCNPAIWKYVVKVDPKPSFSIVPSPSATVCCNTNYTLTAVPTGGCGSGCTYLWSPGGTSLSSVSSIQPCIPFLSSKTYTCVATNSYGCQSKVVFTENFKKEPIITPITTGSSSSLCIGDILTLSATSNVPSTSTWTSSNSLVAAVSSTGVVTAVSSGTATISYVASNPPCNPAIWTYVVNVNPNPTASISYTGCSPHCPSGFVSIQVNGTPSCTVTYAVTNPPSTTSVISSIYIPSSGTTTINIPLSGSTGVLYLNLLYITSPYGCKTYLTQSLSIPIKKPVVYLTGATKFCKGGCFKINAIAPSGSCGGSFVLEPVPPTTGFPIVVTVPASGSETSVVSSPNICPPGGGDGPFTYKVTSVTGYGCTYTSGSSVGSTISASPVPAPSLTLTATPASACSLASVTLTATCSSSCPSSVFLTGPSGYSATIPASSPGVYTHAIPSFSSFSVGTYTVTGYNWTCPGTASVYIGMSKTPTATISGAVCKWSDNFVNLQITGTPGATVYYTSSIASGVISFVVLPSSGVATIHIPYSLGATYWITSIVSSEGCTTMVSSVPYSPPVNEEMGGCISYSSAGGVGCIHVNYTSWPAGVSGFAHITIYGSFGFYNLTLPITSASTTYCSLPSGATYARFFSTYIPVCRWFPPAGCNTVYWGTGGKTRPSIAKITSTCTSAAYMDSVRFSVTPAYDTVSYTHYKWYKINSMGVSSLVDSTSDSTVYIHSIYNGNKVFCRAFRSGGVDTSDTTTVYIMPDPVVKVQDDSISICPNGTANLGVLSPDSSISYFWSAGATCVSSNCYSATANPLINTNYTLTGVNLAGCYSTDVSTVTISTPPDFYPISDTVICYGDTVLFSHLYSDSTSYNWTGSDFSCLGTNCNSILAYPNVSTNYYLTTYDSVRGCTYNDTFAVAVSNIGVHEIIGDTVLCSGSSALLTVVDPDSSLNYAWSGGSYTCINSECDSIEIHAFDTLMTYYLHLSNTYGCSAYDTISVHIKETPSATLSVMPGVFCDGSYLINVDDPSTLNLYTWLNDSVICTNSECTSVKVYPSAVTTYSLAITSSFGCTDTQSILLTPYNSYLVFDDDTVCNGDTVHFSISNALPGVVYSWIDTSVNVYFDDPYHVSGYFIATNTSYFSLSAAYWEGCNYTFGNSIYVREPIYLDVKYNEVACTGDVIYVKANVDDEVSYEWIGSDIVYDESDSSKIEFTYEGGLDSVTLIVTNSLGCKQDTTIVVSPALSNSIIATSDTICSGSSVTLTAGTEGDGLTYYWEGIEYTCLNENCSQIALTTEADVDVNLMVTDGSCYSILNKRISVREVSIELVNRMATICAGDSAIFIIDSPNPEYTYTWSGGAINCLNDSCTVAFDNPENNTTYLLTATDINGCSSTLTASAFIPAPYDVFGTGGTVCACSEVEIFASSLPGATYSWYSPVGDYINCTSSLCDTVLINVCVGGTYTLTVTDSAGCRSHMPFYLGASAVSVPEIEVVNDSICNTSYINILNPIASYTYTWSSESINCITSECYNSVVFDESLDYSYLSVLGDGGCHTFVPVSLLGRSDSITIHSDADTICLGDSLFMSVILPDWVQSHTWLTDSGACVGINCDSIIVSPTTTGYFRLVLTDSSGCSDTISRYIVVDTCMGSFSLRKSNSSIYNVMESVKVYPNPSSGIIIVEFISDKTNENEVVLELLDVSGRSILNGNYLLVHNKVSLNLPENIATGMYYLKMSKGKEMYVSKLSIQR